MSKSILDREKGYFLSIAGPWEWEVRKDEMHIGMIQGYEGWKVWQLLSCQNQGFSLETTKEPITFMEGNAYGYRRKSCTEAERMFNANCHGTRQYLENRDGFIDDMVAPPFVGKEMWVLDNPRLIVHDFSEAVDRFGSSFSFGCQADLRTNNLDLFHSGRILSPEGISFEKTEAGGEFLLRTIEEVREQFGERLFFAKRFPPHKNLRVTLGSEPRTDSATKAFNRRNAQNDVIGSMVLNRTGSYIHKVEASFTQPKKLKSGS